MMSIYDVAFMYINTNYTSIGNEEKKSIIKTVTVTLAKGVTINDIFSKSRTLYDPEKDYKRFFGSIKPSNNLLDPRKFYYHNELRLVPGPPRREWDINTGEIKSITEPYFLEMKASYTVEDLMKYIKKKEFLSKTLIDENRAKGSITFLLKRYDIDFILFMLDTVNDIYMSKQKFARSLVEISEFEDEAKMNYEQRITESKINGDCIVVPKKRVLFKEAS